MSFNPVRASNFYKRNRTSACAQDPHAGTKHSDIMRRQGLGLTVPLTDRVTTATGIASTLMQTERFVVRSEVIGAGNNLGLGANPTQDRLIICRAGSLFVQLMDDGSSTYHRLQSGAHLRLLKGTTYRICATGTEDAEVLFIEDPGYAQNFVFIEVPETRGLGNSVLTAMTPDTRPPEGQRRADQSVAKAVVRTRRRPTRTAAAATPASQAGTRTVTGATVVGRNAASNPNSANVIGVNPRPMGAGGYEE